MATHAEISVITVLLDGQFSYSAVFSDPHKQHLFLDNLERMGYEPTEPMSRLTGYVVERVQPDQFPNEHKKELQDFGAECK